VSAPKILIVGGGYIGFYTALALQKRLRKGEAVVTLVSPDSYMTYQPFLPEAAAGTLEPRHVVIPLRNVLDKMTVLTADVTGIDHVRKVAVVRPRNEDPYEVPYDEIVVGVGSVTRTLPVPGLQDVAVGFKTVGEAIYLRNHVLSRLDIAESTRDPERKKRALTFVFVGGGYAGVEALAELQDLASDAIKKYQHISADESRWVLVEAAPAILTEMAVAAGEYTVEILRKRGIDVYLSTTVDSAEGGIVGLSNGESFPTDTLVWTAGVKADPLTTSLPWETDDRDRLIADEYLRVKGVEGAWTAGDCAAVPDVIKGGICPPTAQHALRQAKRLAKNLVARVRGEDLQVFRYRNLGGLASLGRHKGVASIMGLRVRGLPAWFIARTYHLMMIPTVGRKVRIALDWTIALFFKRDAVQLASLQTPREAIEEAWGPESKDG
jgi:NADH dehydrogenase